MRLSALVVLVAILAIGGSGADASRTPILLGADSIDYQGGMPPNCFGPSILFDYGQPGVRILVRQQLAAMHASGLASLRVFFVYDWNASENQYFVPAEPGRLIEPFRNNLINYLSDIRKAGFRRVTLALDARGSVDPAQVWPNNNYDPATFDATWSLIRDVRQLLKQYGPSDTRVDLLNEGAPSDYLTQQVSTWISRMYANYADAFGTADVTISAGFWTGMQRLIDALRASGKPLPLWFDIHPRWHHDAALADLRATDAELKTNGLSQPLVIGEERYNDPEIAHAISEFRQTSSRGVEEVMEWPLHIGGEDPATRQTSCIDPPYRIDAYAVALNGAAPSRRLIAGVTYGLVTLRAPDDRPISALEAGRYTVDVKDRSRLRGFYLDRHKTAVRGRANLVWHVDLKAGMHRFGAIGRRSWKRTFVVLTGG
jgi:hypothetical protein